MNTYQLAPFTPLRISKLSYYLNIASAVSLRSTCLRSTYGAVIVLDDRIVSTGYNGSPRGHTNCVDTGICARAGLQTRTRYELCAAVHAELNSIINARCSVAGATLFIAGFDKRGDVIKTGDSCLPCMMCYRSMVNAGINEVVILGDDNEPVVYQIEELEFVNNVE